MTPASLEAPIASAPNPRTKPRLAGEPRRMTLEKFRAWKPTDGWKYDWNQGIATRSFRMTSEKHRHIVRNLLNHFAASAALRKAGYMITEAETHTGREQVRIPDIAYFPRSHDEASRQGKELFPPYTVEIVSKSDNGILTLTKVNEYFQAGALSVWLIYPELGFVHIYTSPTTVSIKTGDDLCTAMPAVDFELSVADLLKP
jgi:Uma2 family endonuclease